MRLITDVMLGRLARWLRLLGHDTVSNLVEDEDILDAAARESRTLVSRDRDLVERASRSGLASLYVGPPDLESQIVVLCRHAGLEKIELDPSISRCPMCNGTLSRIEADQAEGRIPHKVLEYHSEFWSCGECGKIYWMGRHWENMKKQINEVNAVLARGSVADGDHGRPGELPG
jgi:hypothetical protein